MSKSHTRPLAPADRAFPRPEPLILAAAEPIHGPNDGAELPRPPAPVHPKPTGLGLALDRALAVGDLSHDAAQRLARVRQAVADLATAVMGAGTAPAGIAKAMRDVSATL